MPDIEIIRNDANKLKNKSTFLTLLYLINIHLPYRALKLKSIIAYLKKHIKNNKYFTFNLYNLDENIYVVINNSKTGENKEVHNYDMIDNHYSFVENNIDDVITYYVNINSNNSSCYGNKITTKIVIKKIVNKFYYEDICKGIEDYTYCKPLLNNKFAINDSKIRENIVQQKITFHCQKAVLTQSGKGANEMTQPELILKLIEQLMAEKEKNIKLQSQLEEYKKGKD